VKSLFDEQSSYGLLIDGHNLTSGYRRNELTEAVRIIRQLFLVRKLGPEPSPGPW
jgi:hypothetical protein